MTKTLDSVFMLVNKNTGGIWYSPPATNASDCWDNATYWWQWQEGGRPSVGWQEGMRAAGWRAQKVDIYRSV